MSSQPIAQTDQSFYARAQAAQAAGRFDEAVQLLWQATQLGDVACMSLLGAQLMTGRGVRPDRAMGARLIIDAAKRGGGYACTVAANILASGFSGSRAPEWNGALDYLQRGAELGYEPAQAQLRVLARRGKKAPAGPSAWQQLRRSIDLNAWRASPPARTLSTDPAITAVEGFLAPDVCDWIIDRARERMTPAKVVGSGAQGPVQDQTRTNSLAELGLVYTDLVVLLIRDRLSAACGLPVNAMEVPQVLHYTVGQEFKLHEDYLLPDGAYRAQDLATHGQRAKTLLIYLNDGFEGGETDFPQLPLRFKGGKGDALMFTNVLADGSPDRRMRHAGLPPTAGEKWLFSQWVRDRNAPGTAPS
jgi:prolyl 4-hydroxylase